MRGILLSILFSSLAPAYLLRVSPDPDQDESHLCCVGEAAITRVISVCVISECVITRVIPEYVIIGGYQQTLAMSEG